MARGVTPPRPAPPPRWVNADRDRCPARARATRQVAELLASCGASSLDELPGAEPAAGDFDPVAESRV